MRIGDWRGVIPAEARSDRLPLPHFVMAGHRPGHLSRHVRRQITGSVPGDDAETHGQDLQLPLVEQAIRRSQMAGSASDHALCSIVMTSP